MNLRRIIHEFVKYIPGEMQEGVVYVSMDFATASHLCFCGCGNKVITPISPAQWTLTFDGETISLFPSIGSWDLQCQSHYWISNGCVKWAPKWSKEKIAKGKLQDKKAIDKLLNRQPKDSRSHD